MTVTLPRTLVNSLLHHAQVVGDGVAIGIIACHNNEATNSYPIAPDSSRARIEELVSRMRNKGEDVYAIYHSHDGSAYKGINDIVANDEVLNLVISVDTKGVLEMRGYQDDGTLHEVDLTIT